MIDLSRDATIFVVLFARVGGILLLLPVFSDEAIPGRVRLLISLALTASLWGLLRQNVPPGTRSELALLGTIAAELLVGVSLGMMVRLMMQAASMAGAIISSQIGLSSVLVFDPAQGGQAPLLARFVAVGAVVVCLSFGVHHLWIGAIVRSYTWFAVGSLPPFGDFARLAVRLAAESMGLALSLAAPLIVYSIVFNVSLAFCSRMAATIQIFFIAQPLNLLLGLALLASVIGAILATFAEAMSRQMASGWV